MPIADLPGIGLMDPDVLRLHRVGDVLRQRGDLLDLHGGAELDLVPGELGAAGEPGDPGVDLELRRTPRSARPPRRRWPWSAASAPRRPAAGPCPAACTRPRRGRPAVPARTARRRPGSGPVRAQAPGQGRAGAASPGRVPCRARWSPPAGTPRLAAGAPIHGVTPVPNPATRIHAAAAASDTIDMRAGPGPAQAQPGRDGDRDGGEEQLRGQRGRVGHRPAVRQDQGRPAEGADERAVMRATGAGVPPAGQRTEAARAGGTSPAGDDGDRSARRPRSPVSWSASRRAPLARLLVSDRVDGLAEPGRRYQRRPRTSSARAAGRSRPGPGSRPSGAHDGCAYRRRPHREPRRRPCAAATCAHRGSRRNRRTSPTRSPRRQHPAGSAPRRSGDQGWPAATGYPPGCTPRRARTGSRTPGVPCGGAA